MIAGFLTLAVALSISAVAAYYSIVGLAAIFSASVIPIIIMGTVLEVGKITTTVWLHTFWSKCTRLLKTYLTSAVIVLMFITSLGVFGFLSKAHVEQTAATEQSQARIESIEQEISRQSALIERADEKILRLESQGTSGNAAIQQQIDKEQERIDRAYERVQPQIDELQSFIREQTSRTQAEISNLRDQLNDLDLALREGRVEDAQRIVGARADGVLGPNTRNQIETFRDRLNSRIQEIQNSESPDVQSAREEISRLRDAAASQVEESNETIRRLQSQLNNNDRQDVEQLITEQRAQIEQASDQIDELTEEKFELQTEFRKLEAEVGPIKYVAELLYEDADKATLESAVRWMIIVIVLVFDPLAICLVLAGTKQLEWARADRKERQSREELEMRLQEYENLLNEVETALEQRDQLNEQAQGEINSLRERVREFEQKLQERDTDLQGLRDAIDALEREKADLEKRAQGNTDLQTQIDVLQQEVEKRDRAVQKLAEKYDIVEKPIRADTEPEQDTRARANFGTEFPENPQENDWFLRVDFLPSRLYCYRKGQWQEVDKEQQDINFDSQYIEHIIEKLNNDEIDINDLSSGEQEQVREFLTKDDVLGK